MWSVNTPHIHAYIHAYIHTYSKYIKLPWQWHDIKTPSSPCRQTLLLKAALRSYEWSQLTSAFPAASGSSIRLVTIILMISLLSLFLQVILQDLSAAIMGSLFSFFCVCVSQNVSSLVLPPLLVCTLFCALQGFFPLLISQIISCLNSSASLCFWCVPA